MRNWLRKLEAMAAAVAFAEEGEWQMARSILPVSDQRAAKRETDHVKRPRPRMRETPYRA
jgi:hypothetical protein